MEEIVMAYRYILAPENPSVTLNTSIVGSRIFEHAVAQMLGFKPEEPKGSLPSKPGAVLVSSDPYSEEATAAACVLNSKLCEHVMRISQQGMCLLVDHSMDLVSIYRAVVAACAVVVLLTPGSMESMHQLVAIVGLMTTIDQAEDDGPQVIPVTTPGFHFPAQQYYYNVLPCLWCTSDRDAAATAIQAFFRRVAVHFSTDGSESILDTQAIEIVSRIPTSFRSQVEGEFSKNLSHVITNLSTSRDEMVLACSMEYTIDIDDLCAQIYDVHLED